MPRAPRILISAGEASGDRLGAGLARALKQRRPDVELSGMGGAQMAGAGVRLVQDASEVAVVGLVEVLSRLPVIHRAMRRLARVLREERPDLIVAVDFPDFNLRLAARARRAGVDVVYFVSPQVWAWRRGRLRSIRRLVRRMLVLFPFEIPFYEQAGVGVTFVGHPIVDHRPDPPPPEELRLRAGLAPATPVVALLPGSRRGEIARLLGPLLGAAARVHRRRPELQFLLCVAPGLGVEWMREQVRRQQGEAPPVVLHEGDFPEILTVCSAGVVASGTASLEAAASGLPIVVVYRVSPLTYALAARLVRLEHIAMPNLIAGRRVVPELLQSEATPERIAAELLRYLDDPQHAAATRAALDGVRERLGGPGVFDRAADAVLAELGDVYPTPRFGTRPPP